MPAIDIDIFQWATLGLLAVAVLLLALVISRLDAIKKLWEEGAPAAKPAAAEAEPAAVVPATDVEVAEPSPSTSWATTETGSRTVETPEPAAGSGGPISAEPFVGAASSETGLHPGEPTSFDAPAPTYASQPVTRAEPVFQPQPVAEPEPVAATPEPEDQPFERDGRWWFRRDGELLVYEEGTGEWVPAPAGSGPAQSTPPATTAPTPTLIPEPEPTSSFGTVPEEAAPAPVPDPVPDVIPTSTEEPGSFWKCPTCSAVNGASAATCRMCFTARPA